MTVRRRLGLHSCALAISQCSRAIKRKSRVIEENLGPYRCRNTTLDGDLNVKGLPVIDDSARLEQPREIVRSNEIVDNVRDGQPQVEVARIRQ